MAPITVAVIDDNRLVREGLTAMLNKLPDFHAIAYADINAAMAAGRSPSVLLLDMGLGDVESARVVTALVRQMPETRIVAMDLMPLSEEILELINAGVSGIVMKDSSFDEFAANLRAVAGGAKVAPPRATETLVAQIAKEARARKAQDVLEGVRMTPRELEVIELIGEGFSNKEIAQRLNIAAHTVKSHVRNVMEKLALHTRLQIAAYSRR
ncbi:MAG TPA: response regulator transcription factor [Gemmatimonadaceae bacterium]|nr:response regulator transcription factor [Gemmatimonadaceae bacterium]HVE35696.1 response regulator transcription factor [Gemmatimonadaceae bacterium]